MKPYRREDFTHSNEVRWCPGCGDYAILAALQKVLPDLGLAPHEHVFISGIGCAGRLPYYMNTYGFHTIHGRAPAVATGLKAMRDDLCVWVITGDGDALSIGGNHLIHCLRRNVNVKILLINNQVYGLTKGQFSPTSPVGQITKTSPLGVHTEPINPLQLALASKASFVARGVDKDPVHLGQLIKAAYEHEGCAIIEIYQDCNIFNHGAFDAFSLKNNRSEHTVLLEQHKPLVFGKEGQYALVPDAMGMSKVSKEEGQYLHDSSHLLNAMKLAALQFPDYPVPLGLFYKINRPVFNLTTKRTKSTSDLVDLYASRASWLEN